MRQWFDVSPKLVAVLVGLLILPILSQVLAKYGIDISAQQQQIIALLGGYMTPDKEVTQ